MRYFGRARQAARSHGFRACSGNENSDDRRVTTEVGWVPPVELHQLLGQNRCTGEHDPRQPHGLSCLHMSRGIVDEDDVIRFEAVLGERPTEHVRLRLPTAEIMRAVQWIASNASSASAKRPDQT